MSPGKSKTRNSAVALQANETKKTSLSFFKFTNPTLNQATYLETARNLHNGLMKVMPDELHEAAITFVY
jgi:hypothetical protein